jgi:hypothetical protein
VSSSVRKTSSPRSSGSRISKRLFLRVARVLTISNQLNKKYTQEAGTALCLSTDRTPHTQRQHLPTIFFKKNLRTYIFVYETTRERERASLLMQTRCQPRSFPGAAGSFIFLVEVTPAPGPQWRGIRGDARKNKARSHGTASSSGTHGFTDSLDRLDRHPGKGIEKAISHWSSSILYVYARSLRQQHSDN